MGNSVMPRKKRTKKRSTTPRGIVVTVDDEHMPKIGELAEQLRSRGVQVDSVMEATGMISGSTELGSAEIERIPGVASVEESPQFQLRPPDSPIQ